MNNVNTFNGSLHGHTEYSNLRLRDCIIKIEDAFKYAQELGHTVLGFTDHECISSWVKIEKMAKKYPDIKAIRGNEIYLVRNGLNADNFVKEYDRYYHFCLYAKDIEGAKQIMELSTRAWQRSYMARGMRRVPTYYQDLFDIIGNNPDHVIGSTACLGGALPTQILRNTPYEKLAAWTTQLVNLFGKDNFFYELQPSNNKEQITVNKWLVEHCDDFGIDYIITTDSHYLKKSDRATHKAYLNAQNGDREVDDFYATTYMMNTEEVESYFNYLTKEQLERGYSSIQKIADSCEEFSLMKPLYIPQLPWKDFGSYTIDQKYWCSLIPYLEDFWNSDYEGDQELADAIVLRLEKDERLQTTEIYDAVNECLRMTWISSEVNKAHWSAYYLNLQKIIEECWNAGTLVGPGRGSGVGFILLYLLDITQINPQWETTATFPWRFLNPERVSVLDVDVDIEGGKRAQVLQHLRKVYGEDRVSNVATFRQEKSKSAILTACRGLGIDVDIASYLASLIPADRGMLRTLDQCMYGDTENDWEPIKQFVVEMTDNYPQVWEVARKIEGLICGYGIHAGGVIFVDEPFTNSTSLMRAPDGTIITAFDLHDCEDCSLIKYDLLSVEALDKIHNCIDLICDYGYAERKGTLKETYESIVGIYNLERTAPEMWEMTWNHEIMSLFQMEKQSGIQGIALVHPQSVDDLATLNSVIRLMAQEKGAEQPLNKFARFKKNINLWYQEMADYGLTDAEMKILEPIVKISYGICESQEGFMQLVQLPECGGFSLTWADKLRKSIAKKNPKAFMELQEEYFKVIKEKGLSENLCRYVWNVLVCTSKGYGFNKSHTLAYSLIALQEMNLAYRYPIIFWNCACLISDAGGNEDEDIDEEIVEEVKVEETYYNEIEEFSADDTINENEDSYEEEDCDGFVVEVVKTTDDKKKKKAKTTNYGKISAAIGKIKAAGVNVVAPDINNSTYTFSPDIENNAIRYGLSGIVKVGEDVVKNIMSNRPYSSIEDFLNKVKVNKAQMINLIKSGAFDCFGNRIEVMDKYIEMVSEPKKRITLQNMKMLIDFGLIPEKYDLECRVYNFNKYLKKFKWNNYYLINEIAFNFYEKHFNMDYILPSESDEAEFMIKQTTWDNIYQSHMDKVRPFVKEHNKELLAAVNKRLKDDMWNKYCEGNISKWEMDAVSFYSHEHELAFVDKFIYELDDFESLDSEPVVERLMPIKGSMVPIFKLSRIAGTVLDRDKAKKTVTLLTTTGVVTVKIYGNAFANYDKQLSVKGADGKKHVIEKSWFARGNKIIVCGMRREDSFVAKKYSRTPHHLIELITQVNDDGTIIVKGEREVEG